MQELKKILIFKNDVLFELGFREIVYMYRSNGDRAD